MMLGEPVTVIAQSFGRLGELDGFRDRLRWGMAADDRRLVEYAEAHVLVLDMGWARRYRLRPAPSQPSRFSRVGVVAGGLPVGGDEKLLEHGIPRKREVAPVVAAAAKSHDPPLCHFIGEAAQTARGVRVCRRRILEVSK